MEILIQESNTKHTFRNNEVKAVIVKRTKLKATGGYGKQGTKMDDLLSYAWRSVIILFSLLGAPPVAVAQFTLLDTKQTGVGFVNKLTESESANVLAYEYFYN